MLDPQLSVHQEWKRWKPETTCWRCVRNVLASRCWSFSIFFKHPDTPILQRSRRFHGVFHYVSILHHNQTLDLCHGACNYRIHYVISPLSVGAQKEYFREARCCLPRTQIRTIAEVSYSAGTDQDWGIRSWDSNKSWGQVDRSRSGSYCFRHNHNTDIIWTWIISIPSSVSLTNSLFLS